MRVEPVRGEVCVEQEEGVLRDFLCGREEDEPRDVREPGASAQLQPGVLTALFLPRLPRHLIGLSLVQRRLPRGQMPAEEGRQGRVPSHRVPWFGCQGGLREPPHMRRLHFHFQVCQH